jgi:hypothetical protein
MLTRPDCFDRLQPGLTQETTMTRKELEKRIGLPICTYRKDGMVRVEVKSDDFDHLMRFPYAGQGETVAEACKHFVEIHKVEG